MRKILLRWHGLRGVGTCGIHEPLEQDPSLGGPLMSAPKIMIDIPFVLQQDLSIVAN